MLGDPISNDLREAFEHAVVNFRAWDTGGPEPRISFDLKPFTVAEVCDRSGLFSDAVRDSIYDVVRELAADFRNSPWGANHKCEAPEDRSYASVAQCLRGLYKARVDYYRGRKLGQS
jgi:hypothetical protein